MTSKQTPDVIHSDRLRQLAESRKQILGLPADKALAAIVKHPQPAALVHSFPEADLHFLLHDIGLDNALPLLALASNRQWEYLMDMEIWNRDQLNIQSTTSWLQLLLQADPDRLVRWCFDQQLDLLELYLFRNIEIRVRESDQVPSEFGEGFFTDDDTLYIRFVDYPVATPQEEAVKARRNQMLSQLLRRLSIADHPRYQGLLLESAGLIPAESEEELYRLRNVRLGEKGLLPFEAAIGVYQPLQPGQLAARGRKVIQPAASQASRVPVPQLASDFLDGKDLFTQALKHIDASHEVGQLQAELAGLCNQVITADQETIRGRAQLQAAVAKVSGYLSIGLERLTAETTGNRSAAAAVHIRQHMLSDIFRTGYAGALELKWRAGAWHAQSWSQAQKLGLTFWGESWLGRLGGLLIESPKYYDPDYIDSNYREFRNQAEIDETGRVLDQVVALDQLFSLLAVEKAAPPKNRLLTYKSLLLTLWARACLNMPPSDPETSTLAIGLSAFKAFYDSLWTVKANRHFIDDDRKTDFLHWAADASGQSAADLSASLGLVFEALFEEIERELAAVAPNNLDRRHVHLFLLSA